MKLTKNLLKKALVLLVLSAPIQPVLGGMGEDFGKEASINVRLGAAELSDALAKAFSNTIFQQNNFIPAAKTASFCFLGLALGGMGIKLIYDSFQDNQKPNNPNNGTAPQKRSYAKPAVGLCALCAGISCIAWGNKLA